MAMQIAYSRQNAVRECASLDSHLVTISSNAENNFVLDLMIRSYAAAGVSWYVCMSRVKLHIARPPVSDMLMTKKHKKCVYG